MATYYIDPSTTGTEVGTYDNPFKNWSDVTFESNNTYSFIGQHWIRYPNIGEELNGVFNPVIVEDGMFHFSGLSNVIFNCVQGGAGDDVPAHFNSSPNFHFSGLTTGVIFDSCDNISISKWVFTADWKEYDDWSGSESDINLMVFSGNCYNIDSQNCYFLSSNIGLQFDNTSGITLDGCYF